MPASPQIFPLYATSGPIGKPIGPGKQLVRDVSVGDALRLLFLRDDSDTSGTDFSAMTLAGVLSRTKGSAPELTVDAARFHLLTDAATGKPGFYVDLLDTETAALEDGSHTFRPIDLTTGIGHALALVEIWLLASSEYTPGIGPALGYRSANTFLAGPASGSPASPAFRLLVAADIPGLSGTYQPLDADLTAIAALTTTGILVRTAPDTWSTTTHPTVTQLIFSGGPTVNQSGSSIVLSGGLEVPGGILSSDSPNTFGDTTFTSGLLSLGTVTATRFTAGSFDAGNGFMNVTGTVFIDGSIELDNGSRIDSNGTATFGGEVLGVSPSSSSGFATKGYVDNLIQGMKWKAEVRVATTANGTLSTAFANGQTVDGVAISTGDRILLKDQSTGSENGIYTVNASGAPTRATDADSGTELVNAAVFVRSGTTNHDKAWVCTNDSITIGSTAIVWTTFGSAIGALIASNNLSDLTNVTTAMTNLAGGNAPTGSGGLVRANSPTISGLFVVASLQLDTFVFTGSSMTINGYAVDFTGGTLGGLVIPETSISGSINAQTGTSYALVLSDDHKTVTLSNASAITLTVPPNSTVAFIVGARVDLIQKGAGQVTLSPGSGVTIDSKGGKTLIAGQWSAASLEKISTNEWVLIGDLA